MPHCPACNGSVPGTAVSCPHCNIALNLSQSAASPRRDSSITGIVAVAAIGMLLLLGVVFGIRMFAVELVRPTPAPPPPTSTVVSPSEPFREIEPGAPQDQSESSAEATPALPVPKLP